ncbi:YHS domain-containing protein [Arthrobacter sp. ISL-72]|uniref:YHS domain-containing protein n=1 Tax=Arthrobacter sp. ISL-72 TaxID=2819114 RepID=UPI001BE955F6|nr:YHS domain-containing protein [Arthrobacter sp. ISL-72]MBT2597979.1 YHS domain-containing protein [Arthrobacter sp. ISL-72]
MGQNTGSCFGGNTTTNRARDLSLTTRSEQSENNIALCQVMAGTPVVKAEAEAKGLYRDYKGQRYWFCCAGCGPAFDAAPDKYAQAC